ncbi:MAG: hypothetical protein ACLSCE_07920 [Bacteroides cellulosilyticus]
MRRIGKVISLMWALSVCIGCHEKHDDSLFFNGEIQTIKDSGKETKKVALKRFFWMGRISDILPYMILSCFL